MSYYTCDILSDIKYHIDNKKPFSICRNGDGDLKLIYSLLYDKVIIGNSKLKQQGIPEDIDINEILEIYISSSNFANYVSGFDIYNNKNFWKRSFSKGTAKKIKNWKEIYNKVGITNNKYCSPEIGYFLFLDIFDYNLLDLIKDKKIGLVNNYKESYEFLKSKSLDVIFIETPGRYSNHYQKRETIKEKILNVINNVDIFLVGAGTIGRNYSMLIKEHEKIAIDIGQVFDSWSRDFIPPRISKFVCYSKKDPILFSLTEEGLKYKNMI